MRKIKKIKTKLVLILSAMLSSSILLSSCSSVITNDNSNVEKPVPSIDLKILNNRLINKEFDENNNVVSNSFDLFLKNLGFGIESTIINIGNIWNYQILPKICNVLNTMNIIKFDKDVKYNFYLVDGKENVSVGLNLNSYKIILKIDAIEEVKSINFFGKDLVSLNNNEFLFFENINKTRDYGIEVEDRFTIDEISGEGGIDKVFNSNGRKLISTSGNMTNKKNYHGYNSFNLLVKHLYNLGIYDIHKFHYLSNEFKIVEGKGIYDSYYNIDETVYNYQYWYVNDKMELENLLNTKYKNKSFDIIKDRKDIGYTIAFKTFPY